MMIKRKGKAQKPRPKAKKAGSARKAMRRKGKPARPVMKKKPVGKRPAKKAKRPVGRKMPVRGGKKKAASGAPRPRTKRQEERLKIDQGKIIELIDRGRGRGFVTDSEVLGYFPTIEDNIGFLDQIYDELEKANIKVIETSQLIDVPKEADVDVKGLGDGHLDVAALDAVQSYLKEIGREGLLKSEDERELAKRIEKGDEEARRQFIRANLRLVVSIANRYVNRSPNQSI